MAHVYNDGVLLTDPLTDNLTWVAHYMVMKNGVPGVVGT